GGSGDGFLAGIGNGLANQSGQLTAYSAIETVRDQNGLLVEEIIFNKDGTQIHHQYYKNMTAALSNAAMEVPDESTWTVTGNGDAITAGKKSVVNVSGNGNSVVVSGPQSSVQVTGADN